MIKPLFKRILLGLVICFAITSIEANSNEADQVEVSKAARNRVLVRQIHGQLLIALRYRYLGEAKRLIQELERMEPESGEIFYFKGALAYSRNMPAESAVNLRQAVKLDPRLEPAWNLLGKIYADGERYQEALPAFEGAIKESPYDPTYLYNYAYALFRLNSFKEALAAIDRCVTSKPNMKEGHYLRGLIAEKLDRPDETLRSFALAKDYGFQDAEFLLRYLKLAEKANDEKTMLSLFAAMDGDRRPEVIRIQVALRLKYAEYSKVLGLLKPLVTSKEATFDDKKNYTMAGRKLGVPLKTMLQVMKLNAQESKDLEELAKDWNPASVLDPLAHDPVVSPAQ